MLLISHCFPFLFVLFLLSSAWQLILERITGLVVPLMMLSILLLLNQDIPVIRKEIK